MTKISFEVDVPAGIDPADIGTLGEAVLDYLVRDYLNMADEEVSKQAALESDEGLERWVSKTFYRDHPPIVRAQIYKSIKPDQEIWMPLHSYCHDPRRPVFMRGSLELLVARYSRTQPHIANGWAEAVAKRFLRKSRYTSLDRKEHSANMLALELALGKKYHISNAFTLRWDYDWEVSDPPCARESRCKTDLDRELREFRATRGDHEEYGAWINGRHTWLSEHQARYIRRLYSIIRKTKKLDERRSLLFGDRRLAA